MPTIVRYPIRAVVIALVATVLTHSVAFGQQHIQSSRPFVQSIQALGMGDAVAAVPATQTAFFYNPAHFAYIPPMRPIINAVGVRTTFNSGVSPSPSCSGETSVIAEIDTST